MSDPCPECQSPALRMDEAGNLLCGKCGLVVRENLDTGPDWRAYDPATSHTGPPGGELTTTVDASGRDGQGQPLDAEARRRAATIQHWQKQIRLSRLGGRTALVASREVERLGAALNLPRPARDLAMELFRRASEKGAVRGRATEGVVAALVYAACRQVRLPRTLDEVAENTHLHRIELSRLYRHLARELEMALPPPSAIEFLPRFTSELQLPLPTEQMARDLLELAIEQGLIGGASPTALAGAALYLACRLSGERRSQGIVAEAVGVTEVTIRNRYKELKTLLKL